MGDWLLYGANGYSAQLAAELAVARGMQPVLGGRSEAAVKAVAQRLGLDFRVFGLGDPDALARALGDFRVVAHCAGPFSRTAAPMMRAALTASVHYVDITGEFLVFEEAQRLHLEAQAAGIVLCPGVGFDVIPTDCVAACLKQTLPDATGLELAFSASGALSHGTLKTTIEGLPLGFFVRKNGQLEKVGRTYAHRRIDFGQGEQPVAVLSWGDISTAYWTTGIPNILVYLPYQGGVPMLWLSDLLLPLLAAAPIRALLEARLKPGGPDAERRAAGSTVVWGQASNAAGVTRTARLTTANGYSVTAEGVVTAARHLLDHPPGQGGYFTPSQLLGARAIEHFVGSSAIEIS